MIKTREFPESNYRGIWYEGKTIRIALDPKKPITELEYPEFYDIKITGKCEGECPWCLDGETLIDTIDGKKKIKDITTDDTLININMKNMNVVTNRVSQLFERKHNGDIIEILTETGVTLKITPNHEVNTINRGWVKAGDLTEDDELSYLN